MTTHLVTYLDVSKAFRSENWPLLGEYYSILWTRVVFIICQKVGILTNRRLRSLV